MKTLIRNISRCAGFTGEVRTPFSVLIGEDGRIEELPSPFDDSACGVIDASGLWLSPGWIDLHTHVYKGVCDIGIDPDLAGPARGVTVVTDAGSAGHITFPGLRDYIIKRREYEIYSFLNYGSAGIIRCNVIGDYETDDFIQPEETLACIEENRAYIRGLKLRACEVVLKGRRGIELVKEAAALARRANVPLMVHVGEPGPELGDILNALGAGDIVTHCFHGKPGGIISPIDGRIIKEARAARERGVLFDIGHGGASFSYKIGQAAMAQGFKPDLVSTDLHAQSYPEPAESLSAAMTKMISLGIDADEVVTMVTQRAARVLKLGEERLKLSPGTPARFTLYRMEERRRTLFDSVGNPIEARLTFVPVMAIVGRDTYPVKEP